MKFITALVFCYGLTLYASAQNPRVTIDYPKIIYAEKEYEVSWNIKGKNIKKVFIEKFERNSYPYVVAKKLPLKGTKKLLFKKGISYLMTVQTKRFVQKIRINPKYVEIELTDFKADKYNIEEGEEVMLYWKASKNSDIKIISDGYKNIAVNLDAEGVLNVRPDTTKYYKIVVSSPDGSVQVSDSLRVKVLKPTFFALPPVVTESDSVELRWLMSSGKKVSLLELEKELTKGQIAAAKLPKDAKYKILKDSLPLKYAITLPPLSKEKKKCTYLLIVEDFEGNQAFLQKSTELLLKNKQDEKKKKSSIVIRSSVNGKLNKPDQDYPRYEVSAGDMIKFQWSVENAQSVVVRDFRGQVISRDYEGFKLFTIIHSEYFVIEAYSEKDTINSIVYLKVVGRKHFINNTVNINELSEQHKYIMEVFEVDRKQYPEKMILKVIAYDSLGNFITGLDKDPQKYFKNLYETIEGKNTEVTDFEVKEIIEDISTSKVLGICTDYSGSMGGAPIEMTEKALEIFIKNKFENDIFSITKFDHKIANIVPPTISKKILLKDYPFIGLNGFGGGTALYAGADEAINSIENVKKLEKYIILLTDGYDNASFQYFQTHAYTGHKLVRRARKLGIKFIVISFGEGTNEPLLKALGDFTDGYFYNISSPEYIAGAYQEIPRTFRHYYQVSYKPVKAAGERLVVMKYYDNQKITKLIRRILTDERFDITDLDTQAGVGIRSGANKLFPGKRLIIAPQTIANFQFNESNLEWSYIGNINEYAKFLRNNPDTFIAIIGHTDLKGEKEKQVKLSIQRAEAVREEFVKRGINGSRIKVIGRGKSTPLWQKEHFEWQAHENRRVEIAVYE